MSSPSPWPLTFDAIRFVIPRSLVSQLARNPLTRSCYPLAMGFYPRAQGHFMSRDQHNDHLLIYCTDGAGWVETAHYRGWLGRGDILLLPSGQSHRYHADTRTPWTIYWLHFAGESSAELIREMHYQPSQPVMGLGVEPQLIADFRRLLAHRRTGNRYSAFSHAAFVHAASLTQQILAQLVLETSERRAEHRSSFDLDSIQALMRSRLDGELELETLAASVNLSKYHFSSKYRQLTGYPPIRHFIHMKMQRACYLLDTTQESVKTIGHRLGFNDPLYFSRQFRKVVGLSPSAYRQQRRG